MNTNDQKIDLIFSGMCLFVCVCAKVFIGSMCNVFRNVSFASTL